MPGPRGVGTGVGAQVLGYGWELTAYTNDYVTNADHFSGELHRPISWLDVSYCKVSHLLPNYVPPR